MVRPTKWRTVCDLPRRNRFGPLPAKDVSETVLMSVDEYETIRLIDYEGLNQEQCAQQMQIARTTIQGIYSRARVKLSDVIVNGKILLIEGGEYRLCGGPDNECGLPHCGRRGRGPHGGGPHGGGPRGGRQRGNL